MNPTQLFELHVIPCLDAGYNLARWLMCDDAAAEDATQDAALRAFTYIGSARLDNIRPWFMKIVRNVCYDHLQRRKNLRELSGLETEELESAQFVAGHYTDDPEQMVWSRLEREQIDGAIRALTPPLREVIILREIEELEYAEIAEVAGIPIGTVMSRLSRARERLRATLDESTRMKSK